MGKSYLACALAHKACRVGFRALYYYGPKLFRELNLAQADTAVAHRWQLFSRFSVSPASTNRLPTTCCMMVSEPDRKKQLYQALHALLNRGQYGTLQRGIIGAPRHQHFTDQRPALLAAFSIQSLMFS